MRIARSAGPLLLVCLVPLATLNCDATPSGHDAASDIAQDLSVDTAIDTVDVTSAPDGLDAAIAIDVHDASDAPADAMPPAAACAAGALVDLNATGTTANAMTTLTVATDTAPAQSGLPAPSCQSDVGHVRVFAYTAHGTGFIRVSTNNAGTDFDTVAWAIDHCSAASGTMELGCSDDDNGGVRESASTFVSSARVTAGQTIFIVVAGMGGGSGHVELTVSELRDVSVGGACDPSGLTTICTPEPASCVTSGSASQCEMPMYIESGIASPVFIDACATGNRAVITTNRDDGHPATAITLPFAFRFFGSAAASVWPSTNGYAVFDGTPTDSNGGDLSIPTRDEGAVVAPFWQNLSLRASPGSDVCTAVSGTAPSRSFAIEWLDVMPTGETATHVTFEVVLHETDNSVDFVYQQLEPGSAPPEESDGSWSAIGIQSNHGERSLVHNGSVDVANGLHFAPL